MGAEGGKSLRGSGRGEGGGGAARDYALATVEQLLQRSFVKQTLRMIHEQTVECRRHCLPQRVLLALVTAGELAGAVEAKVAVARDGQHDELARVRIQPAADVGQVFGECENSFDEVQSDPLLCGALLLLLLLLLLRCSGGGGAAERAAEVEEADACVELLREIEPLGYRHALDESADEGDWGSDEIVEEGGEGGRDVVGVVGDAVAEVEGERVVSAGKLKVEDGEIADEGEEASHP
jgi:hypothetical protein